MGSVWDTALKRTFSVFERELFDDIDLIVETRKIGEFLRNVQGEDEIVAVKLDDFLYGPDHRENVMKKISIIGEDYFQNFNILKF